MMSESPSIMSEAAGAFYSYDRMELLLDCCGGTIILSAISRILPAMTVSRI